MKTGAALAVGPNRQVLGRATCLCETCLALVPAEIVADDAAVSYVKNCPIHGVHSSVIATDLEYYLQCRLLQSRRARAVPDDHFELQTEPRHSTVMAIVEVTESCNAKCPTCSAASSPELKTVWSSEQIRQALEVFRTNSERPHDLLMVSGGEPTLHPDLFEILKNAHEIAFHRVMLITNGLRIAREPAFAAGLASLGPWLEVYLQFDSLDERVLRELRGEDLREVRLRTLEQLESHGIATTLVSVVKNGLNQDEVGAVVDFALTYRCIRGVTFQPLRAVGRTDGFDPKLHRLTLADVRARLIDSGRFDGGSLRPHPCSPETVCIGYLSRSTGQPVTAELFEAANEPVLSEFADSMFFLPKHETPLFRYDDLFRVCIVSYLDRFDFSTESAEGSRMHFVGVDGCPTPLETRYLLPGGGIALDTPRPLRLVPRRPFRRGPDE